MLTWTLQEEQAATPELGWSEASIHPRTSTTPWMTFSAWILRSNPQQTKKGDHRH